MGLSSWTSPLKCSRSVRCKAKMICTITRPPSLVGLGGAFDDTKAKCPPNRGSSGCVTGRPASYIHPSPHSAPFPNQSNVHNLSTPPRSVMYPPTPPLEAANVVDITSLSQPKLHPPSSSPIPFPISTKTFDLASRHGHSQLVTPPQSPEEQGKRIGKQTGKKDALDFLLTIFPHDGLSLLPFAKSVAISEPNVSFQGAVLDIPGLSRTLFVDGKRAETVYLKESIIALLDLTDDNLGCSALVIVLERASPILGDLLHSLMYVGGVVMSKPPYKVNPAYVLVGLEI